MMRHNKKLAVTLLAVLSNVLFIVSYTSAANEDSVNTSILTKAVPDLLSKISVGTAKAEVMARIKLEPMSIGGGALFKADIKMSPFYKQSIFSFGVDDRLDWLSLMGQFSDDYIRNNFDTYVYAVLTEFGSQYTLVNHFISESGRRYEVVSMVWSNGSHTTIVTLTPMSKLTAAKGGQFWLRISNKRIDWKQALQPVEHPNEALLQEYRRSVDSAMGRPTHSPK